MSKRIQGKELVSMSSFGRRCRQDMLIPLSLSLASTPFHRESQRWRKEDVERDEEEMKLSALPLSLSLSVSLPSFVRESYRRALSSHIIFVLETV